MIRLKARFHLIQDRCVISLMKQKTLADKRPDKSPTLRKRKNWQAQVYLILYTRAMSLSLCFPWNISLIPSRMQISLDKAENFLVSLYSNLWINSAPTDQQSEFEKTRCTNRVRMFILWRICTQKKNVHNA